MTAGPFQLRSDVVADGLCVVSVSGEADLYSASALKERIFEAIDAGATRLVVDLTEVTFIDSTAIGVLVQSERKLRPSGGRVALVVTDANVARVFAITALDRVFAIHETRDDAVSHFGIDGGRGQGVRAAGADSGAVSSAP